MKTALRIMIAAAVATMFAAGGLAGSAAAQEMETIDQGISDDDLVDVNVNAGNPTIATAVNAGNVGSGDQIAQASAEAENEAGDEFEQEADLD